jgi:uncharacterized phage-associated protein
MKQSAQMDYQVPETVALTPNVPRILAALFYVISQARARHRNVSQYDVVKTLFLADRAHLNEWGRPITYDNYTAMLHGPVPSLAYDFLKGNSKALRENKVAELPWKSVEQPKNIRHFFPVDSAVAVDEHLSESDKEALDDALGMVLRLGFGQIRKLTHEDPAYVDAWRDNGGSAAYDMKLGLLFDTPNFEQAAALADSSPYV